MDSEVPDITFNNNGNCNYCEEFLDTLSRNVEVNPDKRQADQNLFVDQVKRDGKGKPYDCIIGLSGGVDSAWVLYKAKTMGLRPLAVHMDNGWNSELAQSNIERLISKLGVDLYTHVINWEEYRRLMQAFFDADVVDVELLYDNAMLAVNYQMASKYNIKWILAGTNTSTEGMRMPENWNWFKKDLKNIKSIAKRSGIKKFDTFPAIGIKQHIYYQYLRKIKWVSFLDMEIYDKKKATEKLVQTAEYRPYPYKHYESIFTRFYQGYILPNKFGIDKRKLHLSTLIASNQMEREQALLMLNEIPYPTFEDLENDRKYFLKKMEWSEEMLVNYISRPPVSHSNYESEMPTWDILLKLKRRLNN
jgi:N-acetyl sugar amidotransferase